MVVYERDVGIVNKQLFVHHNSPTLSSKDVSSSLMVEE